MVDAIVSYKGIVFLLIMLIYIPILSGATAGMITKGWFRTINKLEGE